MKPVLWIIVALLVAGALVFASSLRTRRMLPPVRLPDGEKLPKTILQERAGRALLIVTLLTAAAAGCLIWFGPQVWWEDDPVRHLVTGLLLVGLLVFAAFMSGVSALEKRQDGSFDERDQAIMARSSSGVGGAVMVVMAAWMIGLMETHIETRLVPTYYLYLMVWSCAMTNAIASLAGILLAYRRC